MGVCVGGSQPALLLHWELSEGTSKNQWEKRFQVLGSKDEEFFCWCFRRLQSPMGGLIFESLCGVWKDLRYFLLRDSCPQMGGVVWAWELPSRPAQALWRKTNEELGAKNKPAVVLSMANENRRFWGWFVCNRLHCMFICCELSPWCH